MSIVQNAPTNVGAKLPDVPHAKRFTQLFGSLPNLAVFALLVGVLALGHHTGWKLPKASELFGAAPTPAADWCGEHLVPESACVECRDDLLAKPPEFGFCRAHGVAECVTCHPELAQVKGPPQLPSYDTAAAIGVMARPTNNSKNMLYKRRLQFASAETATRAGVDVDVVSQRPMVDFISANGELTFDPTRVAHMSSRAGGTVAAVLKAIGDEVQPGDILALVDAVQVGQAKSQLLQAIVQKRLRRANLDRMQAAGEGIALKAVAEAKAAFEESEVVFISARQTLVNLGLDVPEEFGDSSAQAIAERLRYLGISSELLDKLPTEIRSANLFPVRAPYGGVVVSSESVAGEVVDTTTVLFTIADPRRMWLTLAVRQEDARYVARDLPVSFRADDGSNEITGRISWISPAIDERTRTLQVRVNLENPEGRLKDKTYGAGRIILREQPEAVVVPREAVQATRDATFVFVRDRDYMKPDAPKVFHVRQVRLGAKDGGYVELLAGVLPGEVIATKGAPVLLAQLLRSNLGAGCGCHDH